MRRNKKVNKGKHATAQNEMKSVERGSTLTIYIKRYTLVNWQAGSSSEHRSAITPHYQRFIGR